MELGKKRRKQYLLHDDANVPRSTTFQRSRRNKSNTGNIVANLANYAVDNDDEEHLIAESQNPEVDTDDSERFGRTNVRANVQKLTDTMYKGPIIEGNLNWEKLEVGEKYLV